jgi:ATP-dependent Lon protease
MEFYDVHFSYFDLETMDEHFVSVPEQGGSSLISQDILSPGHLHFIGSGETSIIGTFKLELQAVPGNGKAMRTGMANNAKIRDSFNIAMNYFKANSQRISGSIQPGNWDFLVQLLDLQGTGTPQESSLALFISLCSAALKRTVQVQLVVLGDMTLGGTISPVSNLAASLQVAFDAGARRILLPMSSAVDIVSVPPELFAKFQTSFYTDPIDAVFKALAIT